MFRLSRYPTSISRKLANETRNSPGLRILPSVSLFPFVRELWSAHLESVWLRVSPALLIAVWLSPHSAQACAACYGASDSPMAAGMNYGILSLLGIIVGVLAGVGGFFVYLARRGALRPAAHPELDLAPGQARAETI